MPEKNEEVSNTNEQNFSAPGCIVLVIAIIFLFNVIKNLSKVEPEQQNNPVAKQEQSSNGLKQANAMQTNQIKGFLKPGFKIVDPKRVYYTKSNDYESVYFIGALTDESGRIDLCIWVNNKEDFTGVMLSANDGALYSSYPMDARKTKANIKSYDNGYSVVHSAVLKHMNEYAR